MTQPAKKKQKPGAARRRNTRANAEPAFGAADTSELLCSVGEIARHLSSVEDALLSIADRLADLAEPIADRLALAELKPRAPRRSRRG